VIDNYKGILSGYFEEKAKKGLTFDHQI